ncbi:MAG: histidine triad nucleotide-binding protein [Eubacteriales bacterium]|nr:histidine triad nucleotide-binding protein [Eubacteriales bacterium]MDD3880723.1 histidine triad nucleotide-binding protein [Eubacteriales bacterium]MDD4511643.1 histidine triad nucleotide-binding protein [Eubacteriales bacterium]
MDSCIFCKIISGEIPSTKVYEDEYAYAFKDLNPQAPVHVLVVPKRHVKNLTEASKLSDNESAGFLRAVENTARLLGLDEGGYRVIMNAGENGAQTVMHLHAHILGGAKLSEKMA